MRLPCRAALFLLTGALALLSPIFLNPAAFRISQPHPPAPVSDGPPRLLVLIIFDQMRGDYLTRWQSLYGRSGFRRLCTDGAWFTNCHYPYANTVTGAGHASVATGCSPAEHGIVGNDWVDRATGELVNAGVAGRYQRIPFQPGTEGSTKREMTSVSPENLRAPTIGDAVKQGKGRVVALSIKERAAALPAGQRPDACYWFDANTGTFVTSTYYRDRVHRWVADFNRERPADQWFGQSWQKLLPGLDYTAYSGPDDVAGESIGFRQGRTFPHAMKGGLKKPGPSYYQALFNSPFGNELLLDLALRAVDAEHLGQGQAPDLLSVSFSSNDVIGHCWGPDSQEVLDVTLRSDRLMEKLLSHLDARVGRGRYAVVMTADHGVCPLPEVSLAKGLQAGRIFPDVLRKGANDYLNERFGKKGQGARWLYDKTEMWFYLNRKLIQDRGLNEDEVENALAAWLRAQPGILTAYTRSQLLAGLSTADPFADAVRRSFYPERCGDVAIILKPYYVLHTALASGTNHGTPHSYDTHVPLVVYGPSVQPGIHSEAVTPQATAAILARAAGINPPGHALAPVPDSLFLSTN